MWLFILAPLFINLWFKKVLNVIETAGGIIHVVFFIVSIITLAALARRSTNEFVFETLVDDISGWTNPGVAFGIGLLPVALGPVGKIPTEYVHIHADIANPLNRHRWSPPYEYYSLISSSLRLKI